MFINWAIVLISWKIGLIIFFQLCLHLKTCTVFITGNQDHLFFVNWSFQYYFSIVNSQTSVSSKPNINCQIVICICSFKKCKSKSSCLPWVYSVVFNNCLTSIVPIRNSSIIITVVERSLWTSKLNFNS